MNITNPNHGKAIIALFFGLLTLSGTHAGAEELGRLFMTPAERVKLDVQRHELLHPHPADSQAAAIPPVKINGFIVGSDGRQTVWVNGESGKKISGVRVQLHGGRKLTARPLSLGKSVSVKPGQHLDLDTGRVHDYSKNTPGPAATGIGPAGG